MVKTKNLVITALFITLSFVGSNIKILGTIAFDSIPGFLAALLLGPVYGATIGFLGHMFTAMTSGFPLSVPMHIIVAASMAITMLGFGYTYKAMINKVSLISSFIVTGIVGVVLNGPVSLIFLVSVMALVAGRETALGLLTLLPFLVLASVVNIVISIVLFKPLERMWNKKHMEAWTRRDLTVVSGAERDCLVIACDSCGAVGVKDGDVFKISPRVAAKFTARVALTEVICSGALPITITNGVSCEMKPTGEETIIGIQDELNNAGITDIVLTGSTEENFVTSMTALAITVIGISKEKDLRFGKAIKGDKIILLGRPCVGIEVDLESPGFYKEIRQLLSMPKVKEIVPVGSKGIAHEAEMLAALSSSVFKPYETDIDCFKSAGPVTCLLILCDEPTSNRILCDYPTSTLVGGIQ